MPSHDEWMKLITGRGGKNIGGAQGNTTFDYVEGGWFYHGTGANEKKAQRDLTSREMRKDGWEVKTETNSLGWFLSAKRRR